LIGRRCILRPLPEPHWYVIRCNFRTFPRLRPTTSIDDELLAKAAKLTGSLNRSAMVREALKALIERESARRLARLGGLSPA
jgi:Arc/MetJ family transcription regulator